MNIEQVRAYALSLYGVTEDQPFGPDNITFRLEGKIFLCLWLGSPHPYQQPDGMRFACKLPPQRNDLLREQYPCIVPAFHWNKRHWSDIYYEQLHEAFVTTLIHESYLLMLNKLPKAIKIKYTHQ